VNATLKPTSAWRRLPSSGGSSEIHVRQGDALSRLVRQPTVWWHWTDRPTLILGAGQAGTYIDLAACDAARVRVVKRSTGGTAVYADPSLLGLDVALPPGHPLARNDVVESYRWVGEVWVQALGLLGITGRLVTIDEARAQARHSHPVETTLRLACFGSFSPYEVVVEGRKLVGLSQVRRAGRILFQSGIYLRFQADALIRLLVVADRSAAIRDLEHVATGLDSVAGRAISRGEMQEAFSRSLNDCLGVSEVEGIWTAEEFEYIYRQEAEA
jgi:lipoate-protein ligase A